MRAPFARILFAATMTAGLALGASPAQADPGGNAPPHHPAESDVGRPGDRNKWTRVPRPDGNGWTVCPPRAQWCRR
ncbi:hypothetical protein [Nocardia huaxiensis]|uniref:Uncharacterized protein n=1 Tax=Nocardia huaxiensis TaxID=2755382 RepID=A0A7D6Z071_9NOCA|nr:hypothetical protein [Nocardia huaxiensis]QLY29186.1 hypothetical protein H0264_28420 [Nocardia huaxiensis]UFS97312.1 hypothetical protein LPY97_05170 [Nocardia huaxiensis]